MRRKAKDKLLNSHARMHFIERIWNDMISHKVVG
jgi:hypothetical protein